MKCPILVIFLIPMVFNLTLKKVRAIQDMPPLTEKKGVEKLLGTINYLLKFIPNMSQARSYQF